MPLRSDLSAYLSVLLESGEQLPDGLSETAGAPVLHLLQVERVCEGWIAKCACGRWESRWCDRRGDVPTECAVELALLEGQWNQSQRVSGRYR